MTKPIPEGYTAITPSIVSKDAKKAIETYKKAFGAKEIDRMQWPGSDKIMHAVLEIGGAKIFIADEVPGCPVTSNAAFFLYMPDVDAALRQAKDAGLNETMPAEDMFWGDRLASVKDPDGIQWSLATHTRDVSKEDIEKGAKEFAAKMKASQKAA